MNKKLAATPTPNASALSPGDPLTKDMFSGYPDVVSVEQLMQMLQIGQVLAYRLVKNGEIPSRKIGREYKIPKNAVISYLTMEDAA